MSLLSFWWPAEWHKWKWTCVHWNLPEKIRIFYFLLHLYIYLSSRGSVKFTPFQWCKPIYISSRSYLAVALGCRCPSMLDQLRWLYLYADFPWISCPMNWASHPSHGAMVSNVFVAIVCHESCYWILICQRGKPHLTRGSHYGCDVNFPLSTYNRKLFSIMSSRCLCFNVRLSFLASTSLRFLSSA